MGYQLNPDFLNKYLKQYKPENKAEPNLWIVPLQSSRFYISAAARLSVRRLEVSLIHEILDRAYIPNAAV